MQSLRVLGRGYSMSGARGSLACLSFGNAFNSLKDWGQRRKLWQVLVYLVSLRPMVQPGKRIGEQAREGQILRSFPGIGPVMAAAMLAAIGSIDNFPSASALKAYFGWAPAVVQSGSTRDLAQLTRGGTRTMKQMVFLAVFQAIRQQDNEWANLYERLVKSRCPFDERTQSYVGKKRVIGRVAGQLIEAIYALHKRDAEVMSKVLPSQEPPAPLLYDPVIHRAHRRGLYRPLKSIPLPNPITVLRPRSPE
jgi:hypothetical protein